MGLSFPGAVVARIRIDAEQAQNGSYAEAGAPLAHLGSTWFLCVGVAGGQLLDFRHEGSPQCLQGGRI